MARLCLHIPLRTLALVGAAGLALLVGACSNNNKPKSNTAPALDPDSRQSLIEAQNLVIQAEKTKDPEKAIALYKRATDAYPQLSVAWNNMGILLMKQNRRLEADQAFITAGELSPNDPRPPYNRGLNYFETRYPKEARTLFQQSLDRDPNYLPALRGAIEADVLTRQTGQETLELLRRALFVERDKKWRERFELQKSRIESYLEVEAEAAARRSSSGSRSGMPLSN